MVRVYQMKAKASPNVPDAGETWLFVRRREELEPGRSFMAAVTIPIAALPKQFEPHLVMGLVWRSIKQLSLYESVKKYAVRRC